VISIEKPNDNMTPLWCCSNDKVTASVNVVHLTNEELRQAA